MSSWRAAALFILIAWPGAAGAADRRVEVTRPAMATAGGVPPLPAIFNPQDDAERRINAALAKLDAQAVAAARDCKKDGGKEAELTRSAEVTMQGPGYLSYLISDEVDCGGAHPDSGVESIVYDLTTGLPVNWMRLLPTSWVGVEALQRGSDGGRMVTLASRPLFNFYLSHYAHAEAGSDEQNECLTAVKDEAANAPPPMTVWLDAKSGSLAMQFQLSHASEACAEPVNVPVTTLARLGASSMLVKSLMAAQTSLRTSALKPKR